MGCLPEMGAALFKSPTFSSNSEANTEEGRLMEAACSLNNTGIILDQFLRVTRWCTSLLKMFHSNSQDCSCARFFPPHSPPLHLGGKEAVCQSTPAQMGPTPPSGAEGSYNHHQRIRQISAAPHASSPFPPKQQQTHDHSITLTRHFWNEVKY